MFPAFTGTTLLLGPTIAAAICASVAPTAAPLLAGIATAVRTGLFVTRPRFTIGASLRIALFSVSTLCSGLAILNAFQAAPLWAIAACLSTLCAQLQERWLMFVANPAPRMPGAL